MEFDISRRLSVEPRPAFFGCGLWIVIGSIYLRETNMVTTKPMQFGHNRWEHDGEQLVAVAIGVPLRERFPVYSRRVWRVKHYDAFHGYTADPD